MLITRSVMSPPDNDDFKWPLRIGADGVGHDRGQ